MQSLTDAGLIPVELPILELFLLKLVSTDVVRLVMTLAMRFKFYMRQLDISTAFLHGVVPEPFYLRLPNGHPLKAKKSVCGRAK